MPSQLVRFHVTRPPHEIAQERSLDWLAGAHAAAEAAIAHLTDDERRAFHRRIRSALDRCGCTPDRIANRGAVIDDLVARERWRGNALYDVPDHPHGRGAGERTDRYAELVDAYFERAYEAETAAPDDLIHVTCTGYVSPSGAQKLVARRGWGDHTRVTHAYHMGCYAAVPALRLAAGALATGSARVDIAHTELCSLHLDPSDHRLEQLLVQSLFADGMIRYSLVPDTDELGLRVCALHEVIVPGSTDSMTWRVSDFGMVMSLGRDVPRQIALRLQAFVAELFRRAGYALHDLRRATVAVHPGGPKILDGVRDALELDEAQIATSRAVLRDHGNMSSATLPHIWSRVLDDPRVAPGTPIPSLAFGPGLTITGALLEKR